MQQRHFGLVCISILAVLGGCTNNVEDASLTRDEARALNGQGGKADHYDICQVNDWYGDGVCDEFCPEPDMDCQASCSVDMDCPQPICVNLAEQACPAATCQMGECTFDDPADDCPVGQRECEICEGETLCVAQGQGCPEIGCAPSACDVGQRECVICEGETLCVADGQGCPEIACAPEPCPAGQQECEICEGETLCVAEGGGCPEIACADEPCPIGQQECEICEGQTLCVAEGAGCPEIGCGPPPICDDTCRYANDGECDDGGPGSDYSVCELGSDCGDCGNR